MDSKKCESSLETLLLLSDYKETLSDSQKSKEKRQTNSSKTHSETPKSKSITTKSHKTSNINISQQIQVENKDFQCVINLNTNVYEHKCRYKEKKFRKHRSTEEKRETKKNTRTASNDYKNKDKHCHRSREQTKQYSYSSRKREVPSCNRRICWNSFEQQQEKSRRRQIFTAAHVMCESSEGYESKDKKSSRMNMEHEVRSRAKKHHKNKDKTEIKQTQSRVLLSPISPTPFQEDTKDEISYDEISSASLEITKDVRKPTLYKRHRRHSKRCKQRHHKHRSSKLDTLIKRTKERERKMVEKSRNWFTSTPIAQEFSSADFPMTCSDMDMSINSASTILLESQPPYSCSQKENLHASLNSEKIYNTKEYLSKKENLRASCETVKLSNYLPYSPSSPIKQVYTPNKDTTDNELIKEEPKIKIEVYSPTYSPESTPKLNYSNDLKQAIELKPEPLFPSELSPICKNNNDLNLDNKFCKIESVKTELMFN